MHIENHSTQDFLSYMYTVLEYKVLILVILVGTSQKSNKQKYHVRHYMTLWDLTLNVKLRYNHPLQN